MEVGEGENISASRPQLLTSGSWRMIISLFTCLLDLGLRNVILHCKVIKCGIVSQVVLSRFQHLVRFPETLFCLNMQCLGRAMIICSQFTSSYD